MKLFCLVLYKKRNYGEVTMSKKAPLKYIFYMFIRKPNRSKKIYSFF